MHAWMPSIGVTNLVEAPADAFPNWKGDLLIGSLRGSRLWRVRLEGDEAIYAEPISLQERGIRDIEVLPDGRLAVLDNRMSMVFVRNAAGFGKSRRYNEKSLVAPKVATGRLPKARAAAVALGETLFARRCAECHSLTGAGAAGPQLRDVAGRNIASEPGFAYSTALQRAGGGWTEAALTRWLEAPEAFGQVAMPDPGFEHADAVAVAAYLAELRRQDKRRPATRSEGAHGAR
jgi:cytochrome c2